MLRSVGTPNTAAFSFQDKVATPGPVTINRRAGRFAFPVGATSVLITNTLCTPDSIVLLQLLALDTGALATRLRCVVAVPGAGSFLVTGDNTANSVLPCAFLVLQGLP